MDYIGTDFNSTGSVIPKSELTAARLKRGECATCGRKCYKKKLFKMIPIDDEEGKILNGRCLHCNPFHSNSNNNKNSKNPSGHSYNRNSSGHSRTSSNGRQLVQRSTSYHPSPIHDSPIVAEVKVAISRDVEDWSSPPARAMSSPPHSKAITNYFTDAAKTDSNHDSRVDRSTRTRDTSLVPLSDNSFICSKSLHSGRDGKSHARDHSSQRLYRGSFHSIASSSAGSLDSASCSTIATRNSYHHVRASSPINSIGSNSAGPASNPSTQKEGTSPEELKRAARIFLNVAQEHGLAKAGGALAISLQDIANIAKSGNSDTPHAANDIVTNDDDEKMKDFVFGLEVDHPQNGQKSGVLDRGGAFPMRCGRLIYTGSTRTLSSMSSIDEGDRNNPTTHISSQQANRGVGKSSRTLGSLSTIDGTNEEEINSRSSHDQKSKSCSSITKSSAGKRLDRGHPPDSIPTLSSNEVKTGESLVSASLPEESVLEQKKIRGVCHEETKGHDTEIELLLLRLKDSIRLSSPVKSMEAMKSISEFLGLFLDDPEPHLHLYVERGLAGVLVDVMRNYPESSEIQTNACEVLVKLVSHDSDHRMSHSTRRSQIIVEREGAGEAILFSSMIIHEDNPKVQEAALNIMRCLCKDCEENQAIFWNLDAIEPILRAMEHHQDEPRVQEIGATVVSMLANNPNNDNAKITIGGNGGISVIVRAMSLHLKESQVVESCMHTLYTLILDCPYNILVVLNVSGATNAILDVMRSHTHNLDLQKMGCAMLVELTTEAEYVDLLLDNGGSVKTGMAKKKDSLEGNPSELLESLIETILETIQIHSTVPIIQDFGFTVLANLTDSNETKMFIVDMGALDAIVLAMVLHKDHVGVQERICCLLLLLAVKENHQHILAANPIELVKLAAHKYPEECLEPASRLIRQLGHKL